MIHLFDLSHAVRGMTFGRDCNTVGLDLANSVLQAYTDADVLLHYYFVSSKSGAFDLGHSPWAGDFAVNVRRAPD